MPFNSSFPPRWSISSSIESRKRNASKRVSSMQPYSSTDASVTTLSSSIFFAYSFSSGFVVCCFRMLISRWSSGFLRMQQMIGYENYA